MTANEDGEDQRLPDCYTLVESMEGTVVLNPNGKQMTVAQAWYEAYPDPGADAGTDGLVVEPTQWMDSEPKELQEVFERRGTNREHLMQWLRDNLVDQIDYGRIHIMPKAKCKLGRACSTESHWSKPTLWKAGAEKITGMLGLRPHWPDLLDEIKSIKSGATIIMLRCQLLDQAGNVQGEGIGGRSLKQDYDDINKAIKMAKKSSLVDAVLSAGGLSEVFTQDMGATGEGAEDPDEAAPDSLDEFGQRVLKNRCTELFTDEEMTDIAKDEHVENILQSLACKRFIIESGDWRSIPAYRLQDALRSLEDKAAGEFGEEEAK